MQENSNNILFILYFLIKNKDFFEFLGIYFFIEK